MGRLTLPRRAHDVRGLVLRLLQQSDVISLLGSHIEDFCTQIHGREDEMTK